VVSGVTLTQDEFDKLKDLEATVNELTEQNKANLALARVANVNAMLTSAESRLEKGNKLAPAIIDWARMFMNGDAINDIALDREAGNEWDYLMNAVTALLSSIAPCTVPVESDVGSETTQDNTRLSDSDEDEHTEEDYAAFWDQT